MSITKPINEFRATVVGAMLKRMGAPFLEGAVCGLALAGVLMSAGLAFVAIQVEGSVPLLALSVVGALGCGSVMFWAMQHIPGASNPGLSLIPGDEHV